MITAILVAMFIIIAIAIFYVGVFVGSYGMSRKLGDGIRKALDKSSLPVYEKVDLLDKIQEELKI